MPSFSRVCATTVLATALSTLTHADVRDLPTAVQHYVSGWKAHDGQQVLRAFTSDGSYRDPNAPEALRGGAIAAYVEQYRQAHFELLDADTPRQGDVRLHWKIVWADARGESRYADVLHLKDGAIHSATSTGTPDPAASHLVAKYVALHSAPTRDGMAALFTPGFVVLSSKSPPGGRRGDDYLRFLERFRWATFAPDSDSPLQITKDHRLVLAWTLRFWGLRLAQGVDYLTTQDGRISKIVAVY